MLTRRQALAAAAGGAALAVLPGTSARADELTRTSILATVKRVNDHWIGANADPGDNTWARATYFAGLTALYRSTRVARYLTYATAWAEKWDYGLNPGPSVVAANDQCAGQAYFDLYAVDPDPHKIAAITDAVVRDARGPADAWWWVDALHMAMPSWTRVATAQHDRPVLDAMWTRYTNTRTVRGLWIPSARLWCRDATFLDPPLFWSRGNGWAFAAHAKVLRSRPDLTAYVPTLQAMAAALRATQRPDGFWNVDLHDDTDHPGPETSGTSLFVFGLATGIRLGLLPRATYLPVAQRAWRGLSTVAVQPDGTLGYVQGVGKEPSSSQPVTASSTADFGVGAFTSAGCALAAITG